MQDNMDAAAAARLDGLLEKIGVVLNNVRRRASFALYALGLFGAGERKSVEPIAARAMASPTSTHACQQRLGHFLNDAKWDDRAVRRVAVEHAISAMTARMPIDTWIFDDTGFLKQGKHSVGVQRQYTGSAGKTANCQVGVSLSVASRIEHVPIDFELYLPESWTDDPTRRAEARIPEEMTFQTKPALALQMLARAVEDGVPPGIVLADCAYGDSHEFRNTVRALGLSYAVAVKAPTSVWLLDSSERRQGKPLSVQDVAAEIGVKAFRRTTWRQGTRTKLTARFATRRVVVKNDSVPDPSRREHVWLLIEWEDTEQEPTKFYLATLPRGIRRKQLVRIVKERYRTERVYQEMKGGLGLDHFEGRRFPGWHHHVTVALCCYAFIVAERSQHFPPSGRRARSSKATSANRRAA